MQKDQIKYIVIGGSAGSFRVIVKIISSLPDNFPLPIILCLHRLKHVRSGFIEALEIKSKMKIIEPYDKMHIKSGQIYLAPANYHLQVELGNHFSLSNYQNVNHSRPSIDITFETAATVFRNKMLGILLSGANRDGAAGMKAVKMAGGYTVIQNPAECQARTMPEAAMKIAKIDEILNTNQIIELLLKFTS